jgi:hypothetical protein
MLNMPKVFMASYRRFFYPVCLWPIFNIWQQKLGVAQSTFVAGVKQQPPMHQFRMRPFKPFWG